MRIPSALRSAATEEYAVVGVYARIDESGRGEIESCLKSIQGASSFEVGQPTKLGFLVEAPSLDEAHDVLEHQIRQIPGVLGTWPVYAGFEPAAGTITNDLESIAGEGEPS